VTTLYCFHPIFLLHDTGQHHPECKARVEAIHAVLEGRAFSGLLRREPPAVDDSTLRLVHDRAYIDYVESSVPTRGHYFLDSDTVIAPSSVLAARHAVGAVCLAVDAVMDGTCENAFCAVRPPGHHAEPDKAMGFCLFNNVAVAAYHALEAYGLARMAILDFDVHHGNGTQRAVEHDPRILFVSTHESPLYPFSGAESEKGVGNIINHPLKAGTDGAMFLAVWERLLVQVRDFMPQLIVVSAGFDAHRQDPLANTQVETDDFARLSAMLVALARTCCHGRLVSSLEGGYNVEALAESVGAHVRALMEA